MEPDPNSQIRLSGSRLQVEGAMVPLHPRNLPAKSTGQGCRSSGTSVSSISFRNRGPALSTFFGAETRHPTGRPVHTCWITPVVIGDLIGFSRFGAKISLISPTKKEGLTATWLINNESSLFHRLCIHVKCGDSMYI